VETNESRLAKFMSAKEAIQMQMDRVYDRLIGVRPDYVRKTPKTEHDHAMLLKAERKRQRKRNRRATELRKR
jgi:hypothetical protein